MQEKQGCCRDLHDTVVRTLPLGDRPLRPPAGGTPRVIEAPRLTTYMPMEPELRDNDRPDERRAGDRQPTWRGCSVHLGAAGCAAAPSGAPRPQGLGRRHLRPVGTGHRLHDAIATPEGMRVASALIRMRVAAGVIGAADQPAVTTLPPSLARRGGTAGRRT